MEWRSLDHAQEILRILERERRLMSAPRSPVSSPRVCPHCGVTVANTREEIDHMNAEHGDVIRERLRAAGELPPDPPTDPPD